MKIVTAHQPAYLPWLGYIHKIVLSDTFILLDNVQLEKNSFTNRNFIGASQEKIMLTVPILSKGHFDKGIKDIEINNTENWRIKHWKTIEQNYRKAPYFSQYACWLEAIYAKEWKSLVDLTDEMLIFFLKELCISTRMVKQSDMQINSHKQNLVLDLCKASGANLYVSGKLGKEYLDIEQFASEGISVYFQDYVHPEYKQTGKHPFIPFLGLIDLLLNIGKEHALEVVLQNNIKRIDLLKGVIQ